MMSQPMTSPLPSLDPREIALDWLSRLSSSFLFSASSAASSFASLFQPAGVLRDSLIFSWDVRSIVGPTAITAYVQRGLESEAPRSVAYGGLTEFVLDERTGLESTILEFDQPGAVEFAFVYRTKTGLGRGSARLFSSERSSGRDAHEVRQNRDWLAGSAYFMLDRIAEHGEIEPELGVYDNHTSHWSEVRERRRKEIEADPYVLVVGAGQTGLNIATRFKQLGISTLVIDREDHVGDVWRKRYSALSLHTTKDHHTLLSAPYPDNWPIYTPARRFADWLESYPVTQDLVVWTSTTLLPTPTHDPVSKRWTLSVKRSDKTIQLCPAHVVLATGSLGLPFTPSPPGQDGFQGTILHSSSYTEPFPFKDQHVLIVGSANTAADLSVDLHSTAASVTLLQRSPTCVSFPGAMRAYWNAAMPSGISPSISDFKSNAVPGIVRARLVKEFRETIMESGGDPDVMDEEDQRRKKGLEDAGIRMWGGPDGLGLYGELTRRLAGHLLDIWSFSDAVINGKIAIRAGEITHFTVDGVELSDGSRLNVDTVIFATGYRDVCETWKTIFGEEVVDRAGKVWGLDAEGEFVGAYRPTGHPALWYGTGDFAHSRWLSKQLGLLIQAHQLKLL